MEETNSIYNKVIRDHKTLNQTLSILRFKNKKIVFTNGCFDIIHRGHVEYLNEASKLGDILILGLNTDDSIKRIKGPTRPIVDEESRAIVLAGFQFIDYVVFFNDDTPYELIKTVQPDILTKGNDYKPEDIVGADIVLKKGGQIKTVPLVEGFSTTSIIEKLTNK